MTSGLREMRILFASVFLVAVGNTLGAEQPLESLENFPQTTARITSSSGPQLFTIWIADTQARSEQGLMFVRSLPHDKGMLFPRNNSGPMLMWMKNTLIPLDMLFVDQQGSILYIKRNATPESEEIIGVPTPVITPVAAVLELAGGECNRRHIEQADRLVLHEATN